MAELFHVGLTVKNLERSIAFYRDVIGLKEGDRLELKSEAYRTYTKNPAAHIKFTYMTSDDFFQPNNITVEGNGSLQVLHGESNVE